MDPTVYAQAIKDIESSGGDYGAVGPVTGNGDRAYGAYQVMGNNIPDWTEQHFGTRLTPAQFLQNKAAQDAVFHGQFGSYVSKYGNPQDAASMWFSGRPIAQAGNASDGGLTVPQYVDKFNKGVAKYSSNPDAIGAINAAAGIKPQGAGALAFSGDDDNSEDTGSLSSDKTLGPGALKQLVEADTPNKASTLGAGLASIGAALAGISSPSQAYALNNQAAALKKDAQSTYKYMMGADGTLYRMDDQGGIQSIKTGSAKANFTPVMGKDADNNPTVIGRFNHTTGEFSPLTTNAAPSAPVGGDPSLDGQDRYNSLTPDERRQIDAWHEGVGVNPTSLSQRNPRILKLMDAAQAVYPDMDFTKYGERQNFLKGYASKSPLNFGGQIIGTDHTAQLIGQMADTLAGLHNSSGVDLGPLGQGWGASSANRYKDATGNFDRSSAILGLKKQADTLSGEYQTLITRGRGGGQGEREQNSADLNQPDAAPANQAAPLQKMLDAMKARHQEYVDSAKSNAGQSWLDKHPDVEKNIQDTFEKVQAKIDALRAGSPTSAPAAPAAAAPGLSWDAAQKAGWSVK